MSVNVIPGGSSVVVEDGNKDNCSQWVTTMDAIKDAEADVVRTTKDAEAQLSKQIGDSYADTVKTVKDAEAQLSKQVGDNYADTVKTVKDVEAQLAAQGGMQYADTVKTLKDVESQLKGRVDENTMNVIQDVKDAESRLDRSSGDRFINTIQDIKDFEARQFKDASDKFIWTIEDIKDSDRRNEHRYGELKERVAREHAASNENNLREFRHVNENFLKEFRHTDEKIDYMHRDLEKVAYQNQMNTMLAFKDQALLSEKLAAINSKEMGDKFCALKERIDGVKETIKDQELARLREALTEAKLLGHRLRTFSPVPAGTLHAFNEE